MMCCCAMIHLFIFCWYGQLLKNSVRYMISNKMWSYKTKVSKKDHFVQSSQLSYAMYESDWMTMEPCDKKAALLVMANSLEEVVPSALGLIYADAPSFLMVGVHNWLNRVARRLLDVRNCFSCCCRRWRTLSHTGPCWAPSMNSRTTARRPDPAHFKCKQRLSVTNLHESPLFIFYNWFSSNIFEYVYYCQLL